jgi:hypothetical protein
VTNTIQAMRYRGGYRLHKRGLGAIGISVAGVNLIALSVAVASTGLRSFVIAVAIGVLGLAIAGVGVNTWKALERLCIVIDEQQRMVIVSSHRSSVSFAFHEVAFRLPRAPSLFPATVQFATRGTSWRRASALGQGQRKTPPELAAFAGHLHRCAIAYEWF